MSIISNLPTNEFWSEVNEHAKPTLYRFHSVKHRIKILNSILIYFNYEIRIYDWFLIERNMADPGDFYFLPSWAEQYKQAKSFPSLVLVPENPALAIFRK